jgi:hypothetical protein
MSYAIHLFMKEPFSQEPYLAFLNEMQHLFGQWHVEESSAFAENGYGIHSCAVRIGSDDWPVDERCSIWVNVNRGDKRTWQFDYEWYLSLETSAGRTSLGTAVQLGAMLLAMRKFDWTVFVDHDAGLGDNEPTEFRSRDAVVEHMKRVLVGHPQSGWILGLS